MKSQFGKSEVELGGKYLAADLRDSNFILVYRPAKGAGAFGGAVNNAFATG